MRNPMRCPCCNQKLCLTHVTGRKPDAGEVTTCVTCAAVLVLEYSDAQLCLRRSSQQEQIQALAAYPQLKMQRRCYMATQN